jgi:hypothetical protein
MGFTMSDSDFVATTDEKGNAIEYVPKSMVNAAFTNGVCVGMFVMTIAFSIMIFVVL